MPLSSLFLFQSRVAYCSVPRCVLPLDSYLTSSSLPWWAVYVPPCWYPSSTLKQTPNIGNAVQSDLGNASYTIGVGFLLYEFFGPLIGPLDQSFVQWPIPFGGWSGSNQSFVYIGNLFPQFLILTSWLCPCRLSYTELEKYISSCLKGLEIQF